ncbi:hypothetical protein Ddye_029126 [Dipteronia dyeriana]|uniref:F-box domain-containing protein n=1 Tax=Dipteronia dyeriana TaxID=168575 RepID=A0AAD9WKB2_9ROSI|nr:hypothetical protein Ddye_029126 [Dipteronia dyeriana]
MNVFGYAKAIPHELEEVETDAIGDFPQSLAKSTEGLYGCYTLKTLTVYHSLERFLGCESLTTLRISASLPQSIYPYLFNQGSFLENLLFVNCDLSSGKTFTLFFDTSSLHNLTFSNFRFCEKIEIHASARIFTWKGESPCLLSFDKSGPHKVNIHISPPGGRPTKRWFTAMKDMVGGCRNANSITVFLNISKGTFILYYRRYSYADAETKVMKLNKETGEEMVLFSYPMVNGLDLNQFAMILEELFAEKEAHIINQMGIDRLSNLPDRIIYNILSFLDTKYVVQTCVLSKKWRSLIKKNGKILRIAPNDGKIVITAPRLKFFNLKEVDPLVLCVDDCPTLEKVDIHISQPFCQKIGDKKQTFILDIFHMIEGLFHVKSLRISLNLVTKEKFTLCCNNEETKIAVLNKETAEEAMVGLATILEHI